MADRPTPNGREKVMREQDFIVSKTDLRGVITYGNRTFIEFPGYEERDLLGAPHNIIRHPDMPRAVFHLLWETIQAGREIFAYVLNMSKDGSHYWVMANVMVNRDSSGKAIGYYSVRRRPKPEAVKVIAGLYKAMREKERQVGGEEGMKAARRILDGVCAEKGADYDEVILGL